MDQYGQMGTTSLLFGRYPIHHNRWKYHCGQRRALTIKPRKICLSRFYCFSILFDNSILQKQSGFTICKARHEIFKTNLSGLFIPFLREYRSMPRYDYPSVVGDCIGWNCSFFSMRFLPHRYADVYRQMSLLAAL